MDGNGQRIGKSVNGTLVQGFLYDSDHITPIAELDGSGNVVSSLRLRASGTYARVYDQGMGVIYRIISDQLGSQDWSLTQLPGRVVQRMDYDAFGNIITDTNPGFQPFGFAGGIYDPATRLTRFGARDYDAGVGRWTMKDPINYQGGDINLYDYSFGDPVNWLDPTGLKPMDYRFDTEEAAARKALQQINPQSIAENTEYVGFVCRKGKNYGFTRANPLGEKGGNVLIPRVCSGGGKPTAIYHTHGGPSPGDEWFSSDFNSIKGSNDESSSMKYHLNNYMVNHENLFFLFENLNVPSPSAAGKTLSTWLWMPLGSL